MDTNSPCPVCNRPVPADAGEQDGPVMVADCPNCGASLVRVPDIQQDTGWQQRPGPE